MYSMALSMNDPFSNLRIDKQLARLSFNRAADTYDEVAVLQREVGERLIERLDLIKINPQVILDVGCGTGDTTLRLAGCYKAAKLIGLDFAGNMLKQTRNKLSWRQRFFARQFSFLCADAESLPVADNSVDFIFSNLALQWCNNLPDTFREFYRVLKPEGLLMFSSFGPDTLKELKESWRAADASEHVHAFIDMHHVGDALLRSGFSDPVMDMEYFTLTYENILQLMRELKYLGAHNVSSQRNRNLTGKSKIKMMSDHYEKYRKDGKLPATYEVVYGHAWMPKNKRQLPSNTGTVTVDLVR